MKTYVTLFIITFLFTSFSVYEDYEECDVVAFYKASDVPYGMKALDNNDELVEINTVLVLDKEIKPGRYKVSISKIDDNLYQVIGTKLYIETSLCLEFAIYDDVIIKVVEYKGHKLGTITFIE